jgi:uncharacterized protein YqiB (DUF1249 family)
MGAQNLPPSDPPLPNSLLESINLLSKREKKDFQNLATNLETNFNHLALEIASERKSKTKIADTSNLFEIAPNIRSYISYVNVQMNKDDMDIQLYMECMDSIFMKIMQLFLRNKENGNCNKVILSHITDLSNSLRKVSRFDSVLKVLA